MTQVAKKRDFNLKRFAELLANNHEEQICWESWSDAMYQQLKNSSCILYR
jgi:hypothetical protein